MKTEKAVRRMMSPHQGRKCQGGQCCPETVAGGIGSSGESRQKTFLQGKKGNNSVIVTISDRSEDESISFKRQPGTPYPENLQ
jgi:hypothetical protein